MRKSIQEVEYEDIFEEFKHQCPYAVELIEKWSKYDDYIILVELTDGSAYLYDYVMKTFRFSWDGAARFNSAKVRDEKQWKTHFAKELYRRMKIAGMTQSDLAWESGVSQSAISGYMNEGVAPTVYKAMQLAKALNCNLHDLIDF